MLDQRARSQLKALLGLGIVFDEPMAKHTAFKIGGPADALAVPESVEQLKALIQWAKHNNIGYMVLGGGTNLLVKDGGIRGLVIRLDQLAGHVQWEEKASRIIVTAGVGVPTKRLCSLSLRHGWQGMNFALGIPGSLGGAIVMNAGTAHGAMADVLRAITVLTADGDLQRLEVDVLNIDYRQMELPETVRGSSETPTIILAAEVALIKGNRQKIHKEASQMMKARAAAQPSWQPCAGCFFKNPTPQTPAGRLIDQAGLKGLQVGGAQVDPGHANFIINKSGACAADVLDLAQKVRDRVRKRFGVTLKTEVHIVGQEADTEKPL